MQDRNKGFVFAAFLLCVGLKASAQIQVNEPFLPQFEEYMQSRLQEKIYLHSDKNIYLTGEICWFKLYCVDAFFHKPLDMSRVAYTELINDKNRPVLQAKIALEQGYGNGSFQLPADLKSGKYKIRSYTNWMKNYNPDFFFEKELSIVNPRQFLDKDSVVRKAIYRINLFPEGGNLVSGIQSKVAFSVTDQHDKGISCEGLIIGDRKDTLIRIKTWKFGNGSFDLRPETGRTYEAVVILPNGERITQKLPAAYGEGYVMHLEEAGNNQLKITVQASASHLKSSSIYLFAHTGTVVKTALTGNMQNGVTEFLMDKGKLGAGISHFTVFDVDRIPVCERLYFKFPENRLSIGLTADRQVYSNREKITIHVRSADQSGLTLPANLSMAVYQIDSLQGIDEMNIDNYLWLSSDLEGRIESPGYYFSNKGVGTEEAMDNLMMTKGWRRFRWEDIRQNKKPAFDFVPEYVGHIITGKITDSATGVPARGVGVYLSSPGTRAQFRTSVSDSNGMIHFDMKDFYSGGELILHTRYSKDSLLNIEISDPFYPKYSDRVFSGFDTKEISPSVLKSHHVALQVQNQYLGNRLNAFRNPDIDTLPFYGKPDVSYLLDDYVRFTTMEEVLREYVAPVTLLVRNGKYELKVLDEDREHVFFQSDPLFLLNGVPVLDFNRLIRYDPLNVRKLDIIARTYYYGDMAFEGILNFVGYNGQLQGIELDPHSTVIDYEGLQFKREFYSPAYDTKQQAENRLPDFRKLLYWSPDIKTGAKGEKDISFYSSDLAGHFAVVLQGISDDGKTGSSVIELDVKEELR